MRIWDTKNKVGESSLREVKQVKTHPETLISSTHQSKEVFVSVINLHEEEVILFHHFVTWTSTC